MNKRLLLQLLVVLPLLSAQIQASGMTIINNTGVSLKVLWYTNPSQESYVIASNNKQSNLLNGSYLIYDEKHPEGAAILTNLKVSIPGLPAQQSSVQCLITKNPSANIDQYSIVQPAQTVYPKNYIDTSNGFDAPSYSITLTISGDYAKGFTFTTN